MTTMLFFAYACRVSYNFDHFDHSDADATKHKRRPRKNSLMRDQNGTSPKQVVR